MFRPQIEVALRQVNTNVSTLDKGHPEVIPYEGKKLETTTIIEHSVENHIKRFNRCL